MNSLIPLGNPVMSSYPGLNILLFKAQWCSPCKTVDATLQEITKEFKHREIQVDNLDIEQEVDKAIEYNIGSVPTMIFLKNGDLVDSLQGIHSKDKIRKTINLHLR